METETVPPPKLCAYCRHWAPYQSDKYKGLCGLDGHETQDRGSCPEWETIPDGVTAIT